MECLTPRRADQQTEVLQVSTDLVLEIALHLDQKAAALQKRTRCMTIQPLDANLLVPTALHDPRDAKGVIAIALVDLHPQHRLGVTGIDADDWQSDGLDLAPQPRRCRPRLQADVNRTGSLRPYELDDRLWGRVDRPLAHHLAPLIDDTDRSLPQRYVQSDIAFHSTSPSLRGW